MKHTFEVYFPDKRETRPIEVASWHLWGGEGGLRIPLFNVTGYDIKASLSGRWVAVPKEHRYPANRSDPCPMCNGYGRVSVSGNLGSGAPYLLDCSCCGNMDSNPREPGQVVTYDTGADDVPEHFDSPRLRPPFHQGK